MLSYRHAFHAGNYADVLKHLVLVQTLNYLKRKESPIFYIDTHAGAGLYRLDDAMALKSGEAKAGVERLDWQSLPNTITDFSELITAYLDRAEYPGSPRLAADLLRSQDRLRLFDLHPTEFKSLEALFRRDRRIKVEQEDGFASLKALLPVQKQRVVVLMDPPYEIKTDYQQVVTSLAEAVRRMPHAVFLLWYPVVDRALINRMKASLLKTGVRDCWCYELGVKEDTEGYGMTASGMLAINPPWPLAEELRELLPLIQRQLAPERGYCCVEQIAAE